MKPGDLDDRYLPKLAERVALLAERLTERRDRFHAAVRSFDGRSRPSIDPARLRRLDERYASSGPLAFLRDVPQIGFVVIAVVFAAGTLTLVSRESARNRTGQLQTVQQQPVGPARGPAIGNGTLGPEVGANTTNYERVAARALAAAAQSSPGTTRVALVSLGAYRTPEQLTRLLTGYTVRRVYLRASAAGKQAAQVPVDVNGDLMGELQRAYVSTAAKRATEQKEFQGYVNSLTVTTAEEKAFKDQYTAFARSTGIEVAQYRGACACVYAAVVEAKTSSLLQLRFRSGVRAVEVAATGLAVREIVIRPLLPEVRGTVPRQQAGIEGSP